MAGPYGTLGLVAGFDMYGNPVQVYLAGTNALTGSSGPVIPSFDPNGNLPVSGAVYAYANGTLGINGQTLTGLNGGTAYLNLSIARADPSGAVAGLCTNTLTTNVWAYINSGGGGTAGLSMDTVSAHQDTATFALVESVPAALVPGANMTAVLYVDSVIAAGGTLTSAVTVNAYTIPANGSLGASLTNGSATTVNTLATTGGSATFQVTLTNNAAAPLFSAGQPLLWTVLGTESETGTFTCRQIVTTIALK